MLSMSLIDPESGEVITKVPPVFGASAEDEAFFESEAPPYASCADPTWVASLKTMQTDKDDNSLACIVRAYRQYATDPAGALAVGRQMVSIIKGDPTIAPQLDAIMRGAMDKYGVSTEFINMILMPASEAAAIIGGSKKMDWIVGGAVVLGGLIAVAGMIGAASSKSDMEP